MEREKGRPDRIYLLRGKLPDRRGEQILFPHLLYDYLRHIPADQTGKPGGTMFSSLPPSVESAKPIDIGL